MSDVKCDPEHLLSMHTSAVPFPSFVEGEGARNCGTSIRNNVDGRLELHSSGHQFTAMRRLKGDRQ